MFSIIKHSLNSRNYFLNYLVIMNIDVMIKLLFTTFVNGMISNYLLKILFN